MRLLKSFYAGFAYKFQEKSEHYYQAIFFAIFRSLGFTASAESPTSDGSIDAVVEIDDWIYVFELKLDVSAQKALEQIEEKRLLPEIHHDRQTHHARRRELRFQDPSTRGMDRTGIRAVTPLIPAHTIPFENQKAPHGKMPCGADASLEAGSCES